MERIIGYRPPKIEFPTNPELIYIPGSNMPVYKYITPEIFIPQLRILTDMINFNQFDAVAYNLNGGKYPYELIQSFTKKTISPFPIEYHPSGKIVTRIPNSLYNKRLLVIEDIFDTGESNELMKRDCPNLQLLVMSQKLDVPNQANGSNVTPLFLTVNKWQAGAGMNIDFDGDIYFAPNSFRNYPGIVVRPPTEVLKKYSG